MILILDCHSYGDLFIDLLVIIKINCYILFINMKMINHKYHILEDVSNISKMG